MVKFNVPQNKSFPEMEEEVIKFWKENKIFEKSVEQRSKDNLYVFYDGPPFISGLPHYGHLLGSIAKDIIPRYWTMKGKRVERVWGWDAHGLTVENKVQKELNITNRRDIENYGLEKFTKACYEYTSRISQTWGWYIDKIGRWVDMDNAYKTIDQSFMESVMWAFSELYNKKLIYEGVRTSLFCTTCGTPVSNFEVAMDNSYKEVEDPAVTVKFKVISSGEFEGANILAWTTTPWTLPSNRALVINKDELYVLVEHENTKYVLGKKRLESIFSDKKYNVLKEFKGDVLIGLKYEPLFKFFSAKEHAYKVYHFDGMVNMIEGTGIVHSAPGFGEIDTEMGRQNDLTIMLTIDDEGKFLPGDIAKNPYEGMFYKKADKYITEDLIKANLLFKNERITHRFPYHDRCNTLLIQKAQNSWFVDLQSIKKQLLEKNENINWVPKHLKHGRFAKGIEQAPDWCISRNRFWATPMPVWESDDGDRIVISSIKQLEELSGKKVIDLHRPYIDEITITKNNKVYKRRSEVLDSWFEAGSMPYAQIHYPFENKEKFEKNFPGDYIVEYVGQVRAWFFFMHVMSTSLFNSNSFKNVISTGVMAGNDSRKMSKTYGNYTDPKEILKNVGGDTLRLYLMSSPLMVGENANFDDTELKNKSRNVLNPLWNSAKYFLIYANSNNWNAKNIEESNNILDLWIKIRLEQALWEFSQNIEKYQVPNAVRPIEEFCDDLSNWYVRRSRDRISQGNTKALSTLYSVLLKFSKGAAPLIPFITEKIYENLQKQSSNNALESVHLEYYPEVSKPSTQNNVVLKKMQMVRNIASVGNSIRKEHDLPIRQPLNTMYVLLSEELGSEYLNILKDELNIKNIVLTTKLQTAKNLVEKEEKNIKVVLDINISEELMLEGYLRDTMRDVQNLRKNAGLQVGEKINLVLQETPKNSQLLEKYQSEIKDKVDALTISLGNETRIEKV